MSSTPGLFDWPAFMRGEQATMIKCRTDEKISGRFDICLLCYVISYTPVQIWQPSYQLSEPLIQAAPPWNENINFDCCFTALCLATVYYCNKVIVWVETCRKYISAEGKDNKNDTVRLTPSKLQMCYLISKDWYELTKYVYEIIHKPLC